MVNGSISEEMQRTQDILLPIKLMLIILKMLKKLGFGTVRVLMLRVEDPHRVTSTENSIQSLELEDMLLQ